MADCLYLGKTGRQCGRPAAPGSPFCFLHGSAVQGDKPSAVAAIRKWAFRVAAALLLTAFALQSYLMLRSLLR